jgi:hypothetical protein
MMCDICNWDTKKYVFYPFRFKEKNDIHQMRVCLKCDQEYQKRHNKITTKNNIKEFILAKRGIKIG